MSERPKGGPGSVFLIDANNFMFRAYHGLPMLNAPDGTPVNAVHGYANMVRALRRDYAPEYLLAVFDARGDESFRRKMYPEYKAHRPPPPEDLQPQIPLVREATTALGIPMAEVRGVEADDVIGTYAQVAAAGLEVVIVSSDKDLMQLVGDVDGGRIRLFDTMKNRLVGPPEVEKKFGVGPAKLTDLLALTGDSVDNVPGVPGIGPKTAATLLTEYGDLEGILAAAPQIKQKKRRERLIEHADDARLSRRLIELKLDVELPMPLEQLKDPGADQATMEAFFAPLGFKALLSGGVTGGAAGRGRTRAGQSSQGLAAADGVQIDIGAHRTLMATDREALEDLLRQLREAGRLVFDVLMTGDDSMRAAPVGFALAGAPGVEPAVAPVYVPVGHRGLTDAPGSQLELEVALDLLRPLLEDPSLPKWAQGHKDLDVILTRHGVRLAGVDLDPMLASYTLDPARSGHELEALAKDLLDHKLTPLERVVGKGKKRVPMDQVGIEQAAPYACERVQTVAHLGAHLASLVDKGEPAVQRLVHEVEMPLASVLAHLELRGILLDAEVFAAQAEALGSELAAIMKELEHEAGYAFNPDSPLQLQKLLFEERGLPPGKKTKTGYSTDASVLEELSMLDPICGVILEYRSISKLKGTYVDSLPQLVNPETGRLHTHFRQAVAQTGRLSSREPNLQNIPIRTERGKKIRDGFVAPEGQVLVTLDYSQIELRVLAHLSKDPALVNAFREGADVHRRTAAEVFGIGADDVSSEQRSIAKAVNFGVIYGQQAFGLARTLGIPRGRAAKYIKSYFERIPGVDAYMSQLIETARRQGHAETILGRRRRIPELSRRGAARAYGERIARNTPIQGSAADILKVAMVEVERVLADVDWARMLLTVHDELIFECVEDRVDELVGIVRPAMEGAVELDVPLVVDAGWGRSWGQAKG